MSDWRKLYPFESRWLDLPGGRCHFVDEGAGEPVLFVHGNPTWSFYWRRLIAQLRSTHRAVAIDHLGCGLSSKPQNYRYTLAAHIDNLVYLIERLDLREITLVAHDWGGAIGLGAAGAMPVRFKRLVLSNTAAFQAPHIPMRIAICRTPVLGALAIRGLNLFARAALQMAVEQPLGDDVCQGLLAPYGSWADRVALLRFVQDIPMRRTHPSYARLKAVEAGLAGLAHLPTLLIWGMRDWCFSPWFLERFRHFFPQAEVEAIDTAGHFVVEDAPERYIARLRAFLSTTPAPSAPTLPETRNVSEGTAAQSPEPRASQSSREPSSSAQAARPPHPPSAAFPGTAR